MQQAKFKINLNIQLMNNSKRNNLIMTIDIKISVEQWLVSI